MNQQKVDFERHWNDSAFFNIAYFSLNLAAASGFRTNVSATNNCSIRNFIQMIG